MWFGARDQLLSFREACISNLSFLLSLEPFEKFVVVGGWWSRVSLVLSLRLKPNNYNLTLLSVVLAGRGADSTPLHSLGTQGMNGLWVIGLNI